VAQRSSASRHAAPPAARRGPAAVAAFERLGSAGLSAAIVSETLATLAYAGVAALLDRHRREAEPEGEQGREAGEARAAHPPRALGRPGICRRATSRSRPSSASAAPASAPRS
jgi:hypothetical protein